jgi:hypothetical protein
MCYPVVYANLIVFPQWFMRVYSCFLSGLCVFPQWIKRVSQRFMRVFPVVYADFPSVCAGFPSGFIVFTGSEQSQRQVLMSCLPGRGITRYIRVIKITWRAHTGEMIVRLHVSVRACVYMCLRMCMSVLMQCDSHPAQTTYVHALNHSHELEHKV